MQRERAVAVVALLLVHGRAAVVGRMDGGGAVGRVSFPARMPGNNACRRRPYRVECTGSLPTSEVKRRRARLVLGWGTAREHLWVLSAFPFRTACALLLDMKLNLSKCEASLLNTAHCFTPKPLLLKRSLIVQLCAI